MLAAPKGSTVPARLWLTVSPAVVGVTPLGQGVNIIRESAIQELSMNVVPILLSFGASLLIPIVDQVPTLNVAASCRAAANINIADTQSYGSCMSDENAARDQLVPIWQSFPVSKRSSCTEESSMSGIASYVELLVCLQLERDAAAADKIQLKGASRRK